MSNGAITYSLGLKTGGFLSGLSAARNGLAGLSRSIAAVAAVGAGAGLAGVTAGFFGLKRAITAAADMESLEVAFGSIIGDAQKTKRVLEDLTKLGAETPFEFPELAVAGKQLLAFGEGAGSMVNTLRRIGDIAAGVQAPIADIAALYGKARVAGTLYAEDINELTGRGINVIAQFAKQLGVSESQVKKLASEGKITFPMLERAFISLTAKGGTFYNMMAAQSRTTNGLLSTLKDNFNQLFIIIGKPINDALKPILQGGIDKVQLLGNGMAAFIELLGEAKKQGKLGEFLTASFVVAAKESVNTFSGGIRGVVSYLGEALPRIMQASNALFLGSDFSLMIKRVFTGAGNSLAAVILSALSKIPGLGDLSTDAARAFNTAKNDFNQVGNILRDSLSPDRLIDAAWALSDANAAGAQAFKDAANIKLIDTAPDWKKLGELGTSLNTDAWKRFQDALNGKLVKEVQDSAAKIKDATSKMAGAYDEASKLPSRRRRGKGDEEEEQGRGRGLLSAADSFVERMLRRSKADQKKDLLERSPMERSALDSFFRRQDKSGRLKGDRVPNADWLYFRLDRGMRVPREASAEAAAKKHEMDPRYVAILQKQEQRLGSIDERLAALGLAGT